MGLIQTIRHYRAAYNIHRAVLPFQPGFANFQNRVSGALSGEKPAGWGMAAYSIGNSISFFLRGTLQAAHALDATSQPIKYLSRGKILVEDPATLTEDLSRKLSPFLTAEQGIIQAHIQDCPVIPLITNKDPSEFGRVKERETDWPYKDDGNMCFEGWTRIASSRALSRIAGKVLNKYCPGRGAILEIGPGTGFFYRFIAPDWLKPLLHFIELKAESIRKFSSSDPFLNIIPGSVYQMESLEGIPHNLSSVISYTAFSTFFHLDKAIEQVWNILPEKGRFIYFKDAIPFDHAVVEDLKEKGYLPWEKPGLVGAFKSREDMEAVEAAYKNYLAAQQQAQAIIAAIQSLPPGKIGPELGLEQSDGSSSSAAAFLFSQPENRRLFGQYVKASKIFHELFSERSIDLREYFSSRLSNRLRAAGFRILYQGTQCASFLGPKLPVHEEHPLPNYVYALNMLDPFEQFEVARIFSKHRDHLVKTDNVLEISSMQVIVAEKP
jgi:phospholipid N-methyltransferase